MEEAEIVRRIETNTLKYQTELLSTFLPDEIINVELRELCQARNFVAVVLWGDISGVSKVSGKYTKVGSGCIKRLTANLNSFYGCIVEVLRFYGGDILKFSSDAFLAIWKAKPKICLYEVIHEVIVSSLFIQQDLNRLFREVDIYLKLKLTIACGCVTFYVIGCEEFKDFVISGSAIDDLNKAKRNSLNGDVAVALSAWGHIAECDYEFRDAFTGSINILRCVYQPYQESKKIHYQTKRSLILTLCQKHFQHRKLIIENNIVPEKEVYLRFFKSLPHRSAVINASLQWSITDIRSFIPNYVLEQIIDVPQFFEDLAEVKSITVEYISIVLNEMSKPNLLSIITDMIETVYQIVSNLSGTVKSVWLLDSYVKIFAVFGLRSMTPGFESHNALKSAYQLQENLSHLDVVNNISVGVTRGLVYCGIVGHPFRKHFLVVGAAANKAMKMSRVFPNKISCDHHTYNECKLPSSYFQRLRSEASDVGVVLEYNEVFKEKIVLEKPPFAILGREVEMELICLVLNPAETKSYYRAICFYGKAKVGKTRLLQEVVSVCLDNGYNVACINLCGRMQRPYFCVSLLYKQLYDIIAKTEQGKMRLNYPRELWDLSEALQSNNIDKKGIITKMLLEISFLSPSLTVLIIDNVQYIDTQSYEVITAAVKHKSLRFMCAGQFEKDTWDVRWRMSLNKEIKALKVQPLPSKYLSALFCNLLNVNGIDKKLVKLLENSKEVRAGFLKIRLDALVSTKCIEVERIFNNEFVQHRFVFYRRKFEAMNAVAVAKLTADNVITDNDVTSSEIMMQLYDSFTFHQQRVVRSAATIGEVFSRKLLLAVLGSPKEPFLAKTIEQLFEKDIFDCATRYITCGGLVDTLRRCYCFSGEEYRQNENSAHCKLIYFKDTNFRVEVYNFLLASERRELHLKAVNFLETEDTSCPKCYKSGCISLAKLETYKSFVQYSKAINENAICNNEVILNQKHWEEDSKEGDNCDQSKISLKGSSCLWKRGELNTCFCIEIRIMVYSDLIYHCEAGDDVGKHIFFVMQYGAVLMTLGEINEAIKYLLDALELCVQARRTNPTWDLKLNTSLCAKIYLLLAEAHVKVGDTDTAKKHVVSSLMQNSIQMPIFSRKKLFVKAMEIFPSKPDVVMCISVLSTIFAAEGQWHIAKAASLKSLMLLRDKNIDTKITCDLFKNALKVFSLCGDNHICRKLQKRMRKEVLRKFSGNYILDYYSLGDLMHLIFKLQVLKGSINNCIKLGLRALEFNLYIQASFAFFEFIPTLATLLLFARRIDDAVTIIKILKHQANSNKSLLIIYYAFCVELNNETSLILESMDSCLKFATVYLQQKSDLMPLETKLIVNVYNHLLRNHRWHQAKKWSDLLNFTYTDLTSFVSVSNFIRGTECSLLFLVHEMQMKKNTNMEQEKTLAMLRRCEEVTKYWKVFLPRVLHFKAYFCQLMALNTSKAKKLLKRASKMAKRQGNILESCWVKLNKSAWNGGFNFGNDVKNIDWKLEKGYTMEQWTQILFSLPLPTN